jgi:hypothetical protein
MDARSPAGALMTAGFDQSKPAIVVCTVLAAFGG